MKIFWLHILTILFSLMSFGQKEFHVFPLDHKSNPGKPTGNGSLSNPWDLQTALNQKNNVVNGGDTIWLHGGIYNGRYISNLSSNIPNKYVTVSSFRNDKVVVNGNINSDLTSVLQVKGKQVVYKDFEITFLGDFSRLQTEKTFAKVDGINHSSGQNCKFINLVIYNNPGSGMSSWKETGASEINGCLIFNNGYYSAKRGSGVGIYVQNSGEQNRLIQNNVIFNNYYKGIEVWSDNRNAKESYVKNIVLENNVIFNSALVTGVPKDNLIIATNDNNSFNIARNIQVLDNIFYHNTDFSKNEMKSGFPSLTLGFNGKAPIEDVVLKGNIILGQSDALRLQFIKSLTFQNNILYSGYVRFNSAFYVNFNSDRWDFSKNNYFTLKSKTIRIQSKEDFTLSEWEGKYGLDRNSQWKSYKDFDLENTLDITQNEYRQNEYRVTLFNKQGNDVTVDISKYNIHNGALYSIRDVENYDKVLKSGIISEDKEIVFPMKLNNGNKNKTLDNFGVYIIEFSKLDKEKRSFFEKVFGWLY